MRLFLITATCIGIGAAAAPGRDAPLKSLAEIKAATVFVKTTAGTLVASGSGFVMRVEGDAAYVATNHHVIAPPKALTRGREPVVTLVFGSGTGAERSARARVLASDPDRDLAILKVEGVKDLPAPIDFARKSELVEVMPIFTFGFPFGEALATSKGSPAITVGRGSISSIRLDDLGRVAVVQIDGALNPGNSGGPVVDEQGRLVGVAVATIRGTHIGLAIPGEQLTRMLDGRVAETGITLKTLEGDTAELALSVGLIDPLGRIKAVAFHWAPAGSAPARPKAGPDGTWPPLPGTHKVDLTIADQRATGTLRAPAARPADRAIMFQVSYVNGDARTVYTQPAPHTIPEAAPPRESSGVANRPDRPVPRGAGPGGMPGAMAGGARGGKLEPFLAVVVDPKAKGALTTSPAGSLNHYSYPDFEPRGSYRLAGPAYRAALDPGRGLLYAVVAEAGSLKFLHPSHTPQGLANLEIYDVGAILKGAGEPGSRLEPAKVIPLGANVARLVLAADGRHLYLLEREDKPGAAAKLVRIDADKREADLELDLAPGSDAFCLTRNAKTLYATASPKGHSAYNFGPYEGHLQVIDPDTLEVRKTLNVAADPCDVAATDDGLVFLSGGSGQHTEVTVVDAKKGGTIVAHWKGVYNGSLLALAHDEKRLFVANRGLSPASIVSWAISRKLAEKPVQTGAVTDGRETPLGGEPFLTPDGRFLLTRAGAVIPVGETPPTGGAAGGPGSGPGQPKAPAPARPRRLNAAPPS